MPAGTWNLGRIRKTAERQFLNDLPTIEIRDTQSTSDRYFNIVEFPTTLTAGKNLFKIKASAETLVQNSTVYVEVVDSNGDAIYHEPIGYVEQDGTRVVAIYIYPDTPYGTATVYVAGRARINAETGRKIRSSQDFNDKNYFQNPNVIWSRTVTCAPERHNTTEIIFTKTPELTVKEVIQPYLQITNLTNVATQSFGGGTYTITAEPEVFGTPVSSKTQAESTFGGAAATVFQGGSSANTIPGYAGLQTVPNNASWAISNPNSSIDQLISDEVLTPEGVPIEAEAPPILPVTSLSTFETSEPFFTTDMNAGDIITIHNPNIYVPQYTVGNTETPSKVIPAQQLVSFGLPVGGVLEVNHGGAGPNQGQTDEGMLSQGIHPLSGSYRLGIAQILSDTKAKVYLIDGFREFPYIGGNTPGGWGVQVETTVPEYLNVSEGGTLENSLPVISAIEATANYTCSYSLPWLAEASEQSQSYAEITLSDIEPATGDVYKIKTFYKAGGQFGNYIDAGETILEQLEVLADTSSMEADASDGAQYNRMGFFSNLADYETYFTSSVNTTTDPGTPTITNPLTASFHVSDLMSGIRFQPNRSYYANDVSYVTLKDEHQPQLKRDSEYLLSLNCFANMSYSSSDATLPNKPILDIWISGSAGTIVPDETTRNSNVIAKAFTTYQEGLTSEGNFADNGPFGIRIGTIIPNISSSITPAVFRFKSTETQQAKMFLIQRNGQFDISNLSMKTFNETGFSPNFTKIQTRIPSQFISVPLSFKFQFFDQDGSKAEYEPVVYPVFFYGENTVISGENNLMDGTLTIGNVVGQGIEMKGGSAYIRTIGYEGFKSASRTDLPGGFMMYTGSVLPSGSDDYHGTGLEIVHHSESYFRFSTGTDPGLDIRTPNFFLGDENAGNYISGSSGNIEITSSNFWLQPDGDIIMEGTITATAGGDIGGWHIGTNELTSSNGQFKLDADGPFHISSSGFQVDVQGAITSSAGTIGGLTIDETALRSPGLFAISSSTNATNNPGGFISSSKFKVTADGVVTASAIQLTGGTLDNPPYWKIDNSTTVANNPGGFISSSGFKASPGGVITASAGRIAGFIIDEESISVPGLFKISSSNEVSNAPTAFISSSGFKVDAAGTMTSSRGQIGGATISETSLSYKDKWIISSSAALYNSPASFISSSKFKVNADGVVTASSIQLTGGTLDNSPYWKIDNSTDTTNNPAGFISSSAFKVSADGVVTASSGVIAGWEIDNNTLSNPGLVAISASANIDHPSGFISSSVFKVSADGRFTASNAEIAGLKIDEDSISRPNVFIISSSTNDTSPIGFISSSDFKVSAGGRITASKGMIASWQIDDKKIYNSNVHLSASYGMKIFSAEDTDFVEMKYVASDNYGIMALSASQSTFALGNNIIGVPNNHIAGWEFDNQQLKGGMLVLDKSGKIYSDGFQSSPLPLGGTGFLLTVDDGTGASFLEVENARIRGTLSTAVFEKETVNAVGGQLIVANSTTLTGSAIAPEGIYSASMTTMSVANVSGFSVGEILFAKKVHDTGFNTEYLYIESHSRADAASDNDLRGDIYVVRGYGVGNQQPSGGLPGAVGGAADYTGSQVLVSTGKIDSGFIHLNANPNDVATPYIDIVERTGSGLYDAVKVARLGDLSGIEDTSFSDDVKGYGLYTQNGYFKGKIEVSSQPVLPTSTPSIHYNFMAGSGSKILNQAHLNAGTGSINTNDTGQGWASGSDSITGNSAIKFNSGRDTYIDISDMYIAEGKGYVNSGGTGQGMVTCSVAAWVKVDDVSHTEPQVIFEGGGSSNGFTMYVSESRVWWVAHEGGGSSNLATVTSASINSNQYYHVAGLFDTGTGSLYINGVKNTTVVGNVGTAITAFTGIMGVGGIAENGRIMHLAGNAGTAFPSGPAGTYLTGSIDELRVYWNHILTSREIEGLYLTPQGPVPGATIIEGGRVQTGMLQSTNWGASVGSQFDLDEGTFKLGGSSGPKFAWDGSQLTITGSILISAGATYEAINTATSSVDALNNITSSVLNATGSFNAVTASLNSATGSFNTATGSLESSTAALGAATASLNSATSSFNAVTASLNSATGSFNTATGSLFISASNLNTSASNLTTSASNLTTSASNLTTSASILNTSASILNASASISAISASLSAISASAAAISASNFADASSSLSSNLLAVSQSAIVVSASAAQQATQSYAFGGDAFVLDTSTAGTGLNLNSNYIGYYDGAQFSTYISSSGNFFLGGNNGTFQWNNASATLGISGSNVDIRTPKFFFGGPLQYISGSDENIEISSSNFHLTAEGNVTASGIRLRGGEIVNEPYWQISSSTATQNQPAAFVSSSNFKVSAGGVVTMSAGLIEGPVQIGNPLLSPGNIIFYDDFNTYTGPSAVTGSGNTPRTNGTGQGWYHYHSGGPGELFILTDQAESITRNGTNDGNLLQLGNDSDNDEVWLSSNKLLPFNSQSLYEIEVRVKQHSDADNDGVTYCGFTGYQADGVTLNNVNGVAGFGSQHYIALNGTHIGNDWTIYRGYAKGISNTGNGGLHASKTDPATIDDGCINGFIAPMFLAQYNNADGTTYVDYIKVTEYGEAAGTRISGDSIKTGKIQSNNWATNAGSELNLFGGTIKLGGSDDPNFAVDAKGALTSSEGTIGGWNISSTSIYSTGLSSDFNTGTGIGLEGDATPRIKIAGDGTDNYVQLMYASNNWGIVGYNGSGNLVFGLGNPLGEGNSIAGWSFDTQAIEGGRMHMNKQGYISSSGAGGWMISSSNVAPDPVGFISSSQFKVSADGRVTASGALITGDITVTNAGDFADVNAALSGSQFYENFQAALDTTKWTTANLGQTLKSATPDSTPYSGSMFHHTAAQGWSAGAMGETTFLRSQASVMEVDLVVNDATPATMIGFVPAESTVSDLNTTANYLHMMECVYFQSQAISVYSDHDNSGVAGGSQQGSNVLGTAAWTADEDAFFRVRISLKPSGGARYEIYKNGDFTAPFSSYDTTGNTREQLKPAFMIIYNSGTTQLTLGQLGVGAPIQSTRISGNSISTGAISSSNLSTTAGSVLDLDEGTVKLGGTSDPNFTVSKEGFVFAANFTERFVSVNDANSGSYLRLIDGSKNNSNHGCNLVFDGSLGGKVVMNMEISTSGAFVIHDIELPITGSDKVFADVYVNSSNIKFDTGVTYSNYNEAQENITR